MSYRYGSSILDIKWHRTLNYEQPMLITSDNHVVRIWDPETVEEFAPTLIFHINSSTVFLQIDLYPLVMLIFIH